MNPYYDPTSLDLDMLAFEDPSANYDFDTLCFWATKEGHVYTARDSGCSCPLPFEDYEGNTQDEVLVKLERLGSVEQAEASFDSWGLLGVDDRRKVSVWVKERLKS